MAARTVRWVGACGACLLLVCSYPSLADTVKVSASVWGSARDAGRDGSFESISFADDIVLQRIPGAPFVDRGLWEFDLSELPEGNIVSIQLEMAVISTSLDRANFDLYGHAGNGTIEVADATAGILLASDLNGNVISQTGSPVFVDVTAFVLGSAVQSAGFAAFMARYPNELAGTVLQKQLQDPGSLGTASPFLVVEISQIPVPAAAWLFGSALGLLGWLRSRSAKN